MAQLNLFEIGEDQRPVNVSRVSQLSPFRYAGGKTWFVPTLRSWFKTLSGKPGLFIEPFCGGGICALSVASEQMADHVIMAELDVAVASVWEVIFSKNASWLMHKILDFPEDIELAKSIIESDAIGIEQLAFQTILRNRLLHGGILASGSRMTRSGENGRGPFSRWYPETIANRIKYLNSISDRITFLNRDAFDVIQEFSSEESAAWFIDPPYTATKKSAGSRLYRHHILDHLKLFENMSSVDGSVIMTYDDASEVRELAELYGFDIRTVAMKNTHHRKKIELVITK